MMSGGMGLSCRWASKERFIWSARESSVADELGCGAPFIGI